MLIPTSCLLLLRERRSYGARLEVVSIQVPLGQCARDFAGGRSFARGVGAQFRCVQRDLTVAELGLRRHFSARASKLHVAGFRDLIP